MIHAAGEGFEAPTLTGLFGFETLWTLRIGGLELPITFPTVVMFAVSLLVMGLFWAAFRRPQVVPRGGQNLGEASIDLIRNQIVLPVLGPHGEAWLPFLTAIFFWVFFQNIMGLMPGINFAATASIAYPAMLAGIVWLVYNAVGIKKKGPFGYLKSVLFPPGVPKPVYLILSPIEFVSQILLRPLTLAIRLFANMAAGHVIMAVLFVGTAVFFQSTLGKVTFVLPFGMALAMFLFKLFIAGLQAFIFTVLTAVYIEGAIAEEH